MLFTGSVPNFVNKIWPFVTVITNLGSLTETVDLASDIDGIIGGASVSFGKLASYDSILTVGGNVKLTSSAALTNDINALLIVGSNITVTATGANKITSGQIVNVSSNAALGNTITGGTLDFGTAEPQFFIRGSNEVQQLLISGATSGTFRLGFPFYNLVTSPVLAGVGAASGPTGVLTSVPATLALAFNASAAQIQSALEALPNIGLGNVVVTAIAGGFAIAFIGALAGGELPQLSVSSQLNGGATISTATTTSGGGTLTINSALTGSGAVRKERRGKLVLSGDNSGLTGTIIVNEGLLNIQHANALGATTASTTVNNGAALEIQGGIVTAAEPLFLTGMGYGNDNSGALRNISGNNTFAGPVTIAATNTGIGVGPNADALQSTGLGSSTDTLILNAALTSTSGFNIVKVGTGVLEFGGGTNKGSGGNGIFVNSGTLRLNLTGTSNTNLHFFIGDNDGGPGADKVVYGSAAGTDQIVAGANINIGRSGTFDFAGKSDTFTSFAITDGSVINSGAGGTITVTAGVTMTGGSIDTGAGTLTLGSTFSGSGNNITVNAAGGQATIAGNLNFAGLNRTITVGSTSSRDDLIVSAKINGGGGTGGNLTKAGSGVLVLTGNNTLSGTNEVQRITLGGVNEVQTITFVGTITGGTFAITYNGQATAAITYSPNVAVLAANVQAALNTMLGAGNTAVSATATVITITFTVLGNADLAAVTSTFPTGATAANVAEATKGVGNDVQTLTYTVGGATDTVTVSYNSVNATPLIPTAALTAAAVQTNLETIPALLGNVFVIGKAGGPFTVVFRNGLVLQNALLLVKAAATGTANVVPAAVADGIASPITSGSFRLSFSGAVDSPDCLQFQRCNFGLQRGCRLGCPA